MLSLRHPWENSYFPFWTIPGTIYDVCPEGIQPCYMKNRNIYWRRYKKHCTKDNDTSVPFKVGTLGPHTVLPIASAALSYFPESHWWSEILSLSKVILVWGKARNHREPNLGVGELSHLGDFIIHPKLCTQDVMHEQVCCHEEAANHQLPIAVAFWIIQIISTEECSNLTQNFVQIGCSTPSFWTQQLHSTCAHLMGSTGPPD